MLTDYSFSQLMGVRGGGFITEERDLGRSEHAFRWVDEEFRVSEFVEEKV
jgi:hypothetical protein